MRRLWIAMLFALAAAGLLWSQQQADRQYAGTLIAVTDSSITVLQANEIGIHALLPDRGDLTGRKIAAKHHLGDVVEIRVRDINTVYDDQAGEIRQIELTQLYDRGLPTPTQLNVALAARRRHTPGNLLQLPEGSKTAPNTAMDAASILARETGAVTLRSDDVAPPDAAALLASQNAPAPRGNSRREPIEIETARQAILAWVSRLPDYVADEKDEQFTSIKTPVQWIPLVTETSELQVTNGLENRANIQADGKPWSKPWQEVPGIHWRGSYAGEIFDIASPDCPTEFQWVGPAGESNRVPVDEIDFSSPRNGCLGGWMVGDESYEAGIKGKILVGADDHLPRHCEIQSTGYPLTFPIQSMANQIDWDNVTVAGSTYLMPSSAELITQERVTWKRVVLHFSNYRHFTVKTRIILPGGHY